MSTSISFKKNGHVISTASASPEMISLLGTVLVRNPEILDGFGSRIVESRGKLRKYAEVIWFRWEADTGETVEKTFSGISSYLLQSIVEDLEYLKAQENNNEL